MAFDKVTSTGLLKLLKLLNLNIRSHACFEQEFIDIQATMEYRFTLKRVCDMITYSLWQNLGRRTYLQITNCEGYAYFTKYTKVILNPIFIP